MTPPCTKQRTQESQSRIVEQDWCEAILEKMWGSTSLGRGGVFSELKEQFHSGRTPGCQWRSLADGTLCSKSWYFICSHRRWLDLLCSRRCLHDLSHQTLEKETLQYTPQEVRTVAEEISPRNKFVKNHLVAPAVSTDDYPVIQEDAHRRLSEEEQQALDLATEENEKQPEPWCLDCTLNLAILILEE